MSVNTLANPYPEYDTKTLRFMEMKGQAVPHLVDQYHNQISMADAIRIQNREVAQAYRNRIIYQIVPTAIAATIATALFNVATIYSYFNPASTGSLPKDGTNENCTKALTACKDAIPVLQKRRDDVKTDWKACLNTLQTCKNSLNATLDDYNDLMSNYTNLLKSCKNSTNNTVN